MTGAGRSRTARIIVIGAAHPHVDYVLDEVARRSDVDILAVADHDPARLRTLAARVRAPSYADWKVALAEHRPDAAAVITEPSLRGAIVRDLLARHVFAVVDKPLATTHEEYAAIASASGGGGLTLLLEKRFYPVTRALRELIGEGTFGDIVSIVATGPHKLRPAARPAWYFDRALYGGILTDLAVHDADLALWLTGDEARRVRGWVSPQTLPGHPGFALSGRATIETTRGMEIAIEVDWLQPEASPRHGDYAMRLTGTKGRADVLFADNRLIVETCDRPARDMPLPAPIAPATFAFDYLTGQADLAISTADSLRATRIALLAQTSAEAGGAWLDI